MGKQNFLWRKMFWLREAETEWDSNQTSPGCCTATLLHVYTKSNHWTNEWSCFQLISVHLKWSVCRDMNQLLTNIIMTVIQLRGTGLWNFVTPPNTTELTSTVNTMIYIIISGFVYCLKWPVWFYQIKAVKEKKKETTKPDPQERKKLHL